MFDPLESWSYDEQYDWRPLPEYMYEHHFPRFLENPVFIANEDANKWRILLSFMWSRLHVEVTDWVTPHQLTKMKMASLTRASIAEHNGVTRQAVIKMQRKHICPEPDIHCFTWPMWTAEKFVLRVWQRLVLTLERRVRQGRFGDIRYGNTPERAVTAAAQHAYNISHHVRNGLYGAALREYRFVLNPRAYD